MPEDFSSNPNSTTTADRRRRRKREQQENNGRGNSIENNGGNKEPISQLEESVLKFGAPTSAPVSKLTFVKISA